MLTFGRAITLAIAAFLTIPLVVAGEDSAQAIYCPPGLRPMEDVGLVCPQENGLFEVFNADLRSVGFIHGSDPIPEEVAGEGFEIMAGTSPACQTGAAGTYYIQVIYARATNDADNYASLVNQIRYLVGQSTKLVDDAAIATGGTAALKVKCVGGLVEVKNEVLPTPMASASFSTIATDLSNKGYNDGKVKYWVFYDDTGACTCGGQGNIYGDTSLAVTNWNNGNAAAMYAINYGYNSTRVWLHELGHNMGAVQNNAPRTTGAWHCIDGRDTMCYNDGGPNGGSYSTGVCAVEVWDCNKNDYFNLNPAAGSYLALNWNLGNSLNRFIEFGRPSLTSLVCPASVEEDASMSCTFVASDDGTGVRYTVNWGDSTTTTVPTSGYVTPGVTQSASHTYATPGTRTISVSVVDNGGNTGNTLTSNINVFADNPFMNLFSCPAQVELGNSITCSVRASDLSSGVRYTVNWGDSTSTSIPASGYVTPGATQTASKTYSAIGVKSLTASAVDSLGHTSNVLSASVNVVFDLTPPILSVQDPRAGWAYSGCTVASSTAPLSTGRGVWVDTACLKATASDAKSGVNRVEVWVNGVLRATDTSAPYTIEFPVPSTQMNSALQVKAYDNAGNVATVLMGVDMVNA